MNICKIGIKYTAKNVNFILKTIRNGEILPLVSGVDADVVDSVRYNIMEVQVHFNTRRIHQRVKRIREEFVNSRVNSGVKSRETRVKSCYEYFTNVSYFFSN